MSIVKVIAGAGLIVIIGGAVLIYIGFWPWKGSAGQAAPTKLAPVPGAGDTITLVQGSDEEPCECLETRNGWIIGCLMMNGDERIFRCGSKYVLKDLGTFLKRVDGKPTGVELTVWSSVPRAAIDQVRSSFEGKGLAVQIAEKGGDSLRIIGSMAIRGLGGGNTPKARMDIHSAT